MAYIPELETGETLIRQFRVKLSRKARPFCFAVSNRALYWPDINLITLSDPDYFRRISHNQVQAVSLKRPAPYAIWLLTLLMIIAGLLLLILLLAPLFELITGIHLHVPEVQARRMRTKLDLGVLAIGLIFGGIYLSLLANRRFGLRVQTSDKSFLWKPPLLVDEPSRNQISSTLNEMLQTCQQAGLRVLDGHQN